MTHTTTPALSGEELDKLTRQALPAGAPMPDWIAYDGANDVLTICGIKYAADLMRDLGGTLPVDQPFVITSRGDGVLAVCKLPPQPVDAGVQAATSPADDRASLRLLVKSLESIRSAALQGGASVGSDEMRATGCFEEIAQKIPGLLAMVRAALAQAAPADLTDERATVDAIVRDVCELDYSGEFDEEKILAVTVDDLKLICERHVRAAVVAIPAPAGYVLVPKWAGQFNSYQEWVNKAQSRLASPDHRRAMCVDAKGRRCAIGKDFMLARDEDAFPVRYFWECEPVAAPAAQAQHDEDPIRAYDEFDNPLDGQMGD